MYSRLLLVTLCGGVLALAACTSDARPDVEDALGTTIATIESGESESGESTITTIVIAHSATTAPTDKSSGLGTTTTHVAPSTTIAPADESDESDESASTTSAPSEPAPPPDPETEPEEPETRDGTFVPLMLPVGTCFDDPGTGVDLVTQNDISIVDCAPPHANEVFANLDIGGGEFPGAASVQIQADELCGNAFEGYVGEAYESSVYDTSWYFPTEESWPDGGTSIICFAYNTDLTSITGSIEGTAR